MEQSQLRVKPQAIRFKRFAHKAYSAFNSMHRVVNIGVVTGCVLTFAHVGSVTSQTSLNLEGSEKVPENELEEVTVTTSRIAVPLSQSAKLVTIITRDEIQQSPVQSVQDLLNYAAGIDVQQRGGHGVQADISIRGGSFDQTAILLNGVNLSNPQTGHYSFDIPINLSDIERIEIIYGPSSFIYGASAFSGGINIITKKEPDHKVYSKVQAGGHNLLSLETGATLKTNITTNQISVGYSRSDGYIKNSDYDIFNLLWQTRLNVDRSKIDIQLGYNDKQFGANTFYSATYPNQYDKTKSYFASIKGETGDKLKLIPIIYWNRHNDCFQLFRNGTLDIPSWYTGHNYHRTDVYGANLNLQYKSKIGISSFGAELRNEGILSNVLGKEKDKPTNRYTKSDNRTNISYTLEHTLLFNKFTFTAGLLANSNTALNDNYKFYPSINASYWLTDDLKIYTSWNKATRMPTFTDLYYTTVTHIGNTDLKPEKSEAYELGLKYRNRLIEVNLTGYLMKGKNLIDWVKESPDAKWESRNLTQIDKKGIEMNANFFLQELSPSLQKTILQLGYTRLHQDKNSGDLISNFTLNYLRDKFTAKLGHPVYKNITANWNFRWQKRMGTYLKYEDLKPTKEQSYPAFSVLDLRLNWQLKDLNVNIDVNNLFDKKYFDLGNIPQAGFWFMTGISYTLK